MSEAELEDVVVNKSLVRRISELEAQVERLSIELTQLDTAEKRIAQLEHAIMRHSRFLGSSLASDENSRLWNQLDGVKLAPYPFCHKPHICRETGRCEKDPVCCD